MNYFEPVMLKKNFYFIPLNEEDVEMIKQTLSSYAKKSSIPDDLFIENLTSIMIKFNRPIRYNEVFGLGTTEFNKSFAEKVLDLHIFKSHHTLNREDLKSWQCFVPTACDKDKNPNWKTGRLGITHPDASCSWNCLMQHCGNPTHGMIINLNS